MLIRSITILLSDRFSHHLIQNAPAQVREIFADYQLSKTFENEADRSSLIHKAILFVGNPGNGKQIARGH